MLKLGMFWLLGEFGVMVKHQVFCSVFVDRVSVPFLGVVSDEALAGGLPVLALATCTSVEACFSSLFRADSLASLVTPPKDTAVMATRMPMMTMTMRSSMIVKALEVVEVLEALGVVETLFVC